MYCATGATQDHSHAEGETSFSALIEETATKQYGKISANAFTLSLGNSQHSRVCKLEPGYKLEIRKSTRIHTVLFMFIATFYPLGDNNVYIIFHRFGINSFSFLSLKSDNKNVGHFFQ